MLEFKLPDIGEGMTEAEILQWFVKEGDEVKRDEPVLEIQTDKVSAELTAPEAGIIERIFFEEEETAEVGEVLFTIRTEGEASDKPPASASTPSQTAEENEREERSVEQPSNPSPSATSRRFKRALATPYVRQLARELNIDIEEVEGTGPIGRVLEEDLYRFKEGMKKTQQPAEEKASPVEMTTPASQAATSGGERRIPIKGIRKVIAERMVKSVQTIPHVTHMDELEIEALHSLREEMKAYYEPKGVKITYLPFFVKAVVSALKEFEYFNASVDDETNEIVLKDYYHIGIATDTEQGLVVPVIRDADKKSIVEIAAEISELAILARKGQLRVEQMTGSTFTISNVGPVGGNLATPIINHPEVAILALHKIAPRTVVKEMESVIRLMMNISLSFDHRIIDGVLAVKFTNYIIERLENPNLLLMEMR